jgi:hypothetical protein
VTAGWVAGTVRARAMSRRRLGAAGARALAASSTLADALAVLVATPYGHDVRADHTLAEAQRAITETLLWDVRVFAGWLPRAGTEQLRVLAGWFEVADVDEILRDMAGQDAAPRYSLGSLSTAGSRLGTASSPAELRAVLSASPWGDPGGDTAHEIASALRLSWAERVAAAVPQARPWALAGASLLVARDVFAAGRPLPLAAAATARRLLGAAAADAHALPEFTARLPRPARAALMGVEDASSLWRAEARWWTNVESDALALLRRPRFGSDPVIGTVAAAAVDAWRVTAALECAARGGQVSEALDAVA